MLEIEPWNNILSEGISILEVFRMFIILLKNIGSEIAVFLTIGIRILPVELYCEVGLVCRRITGGLGNHVVGERIHLVLRDTIFAHVTVCQGIIITVVVMILRHRLTHLISSKLHRAGAVSIMLRIEQTNLAGVCLDKPLYRLSVFIDPTHS